jgi:hypothetical protein
MNVTRLLLSALLMLPACGWSDDKPATPADEKKPTFTLSDAEVRKIVRAAANRKVEGFRFVKDPQVATDIPPSATAARFQPLARLPRATRVVFECRSLTEACGAYDYDGNYLYSVPREQVYPNSTGGSDDWLACQSGDDMLSTFERFDRCRGIGVMLSTPWNTSHKGPTGAVVRLH